MKTGRNDPCPCGSGKKFRKCCETKTAPQSGTAQAPDPSPAGLLQEAIAHHQAGLLEKAKGLYQLILRKNPNHADALHLLGMISYQTGDHSEAEELIRKAITVDGKAALFHVNLGNVLKARGRNTEAAASFNTALSLQPGMAEAHYNLATALCDGGDPEGSLPHFRAALKSNPGLAEAHFNLGVALKRLNRNEEAIESCISAVTINPDYYDAHYNLGLLYHERENYEQAAKHYERALKGMPRHADAHYFLGDIFLKLDQFDRAEHSLRQAIALRPDFADAHNDLAVVLRKLGRTEEALASALQALAIKPGVAVYNNLGIICREDGKIEQAVQYAKCAVSLGPDNAEAHFNLALAMLHRGDLAEGWKTYEWRGRRSNSDLRSLFYPRWDGSSLNDKAVLICSEQGIGDQIMFASLFPDIIHSAEYCVIDCDRRLVPLFARSFPGATVVPAKQQLSEEELPALDLAIPMGSLPMFLRTDLASFPQSTSYLLPDADLVDTWRKRFRELGEGLTVGIAWRGGSDDSVRRLRSTELEQWASLLTVPGVHFINLQYGDCVQDLDRVKKTLGVSVHDWQDADPLRDLDNFAAEIAALDLVISVDNATVHMAGALGIPTWVLLPRGNDWRWMQRVEDTPWYPSVRLFRQRKHGDWSAGFMLATALLAHGAARRNSPAQLTSGIALSYHDIAVSTRPLPLGGTCSAPADRPATAAPDVPRDMPMNAEETGEQEKYRKAWGLENRVYAQFSPGLQLSEHINFLEFFKQNGVVTVLDAGIGSGKLCKKMIGLGFDCHGLDIADNCLDADLHALKDKILTIGTLWDGTLFEENSFDAVVCTDVLEHIQENHVDAVLANFHRWTRKFVFLQVALYDDVFGAKVGAPLHLTVKPKTWWDERVADFTILKDYALKGADNTEKYAVYVLQKIQR